MSLRYRLTIVRSVSLDVKNDPTIYGGRLHLDTPSIEFRAVSTPILATALFALTGLALRSREQP